MQYSKTIYNNFHHLGFKDNPLIMNIISEHFDSKDEIPLSKKTAVENCSYTDFGSNYALIDEKLEKKGLIYYFLKL